MKERPILFNDAMVRAILDGRKTQTRRVMKPQPAINKYNNRWFWACKLVRSMVYMDDEMSDRTPWEGFTASVCPYGQPGDRLWVRERCMAKELDDEEAIDYAVHHGDPEYPQFGLDGVLYPADGQFIPIENSIAASERWLKLSTYRSKRGSGLIVPSIHMPRWASRILLEITNVRVERVQDISEADALADGIEQVSNNRWKVYEPGYEGESALTAKSSFRSLWEFIHGPNAWDRNDWVWVIEFKVLSNGGER